jgi:hypothetical protein
MEPRCSADNSKSQTFFQNLEIKQSNVSNSKSDENRNNFSDLFLRPSWIRDPISPLIVPISRKLSSKNLSNGICDELPDL